MPLLWLVRISVRKSYIEATYLDPVFTNKPVIMTLSCSEANPHNKLSQSIFSLQLFFPENSPKLNHRHMHLLIIDSR